MKVVWGQKVSQTFLNRLAWICKDITPNMNLNDSMNGLMACMAFETGNTFSPSIKNAAGSGATGLIQFMPNTIIHYYYSRDVINKWTSEERKAKQKECLDKLAAMSAEDQLNIVHWYFKDYKGRIKSTGDWYMAIFMPKGLGKDNKTILINGKTQPKAYSQNQGLDKAKKGYITKGDCLHQIDNRFDQGKHYMFEGNVYPD